jgi:hypothetical protein
MDRATIFFSRGLDQYERILVCLDTWHRPGGAGTAGEDGQ